ncbi:hypothetical protein E5676_scaffold264G00990 [Cucumis melo var. makuwa]|uniref:Uncharacterized protein n=1 Tax=Cucumis melo var. makuwa TaxID=1194695 RepID=A0A5D3BSL0_CUCMM|nr:hypothetical protein E5676_scaffold264G00990 [Cucumis melo var. makuwa]
MGLWDLCKPSSHFWRKKKKRKGKTPFLKNPRLPPPSTGRLRRPSSRRQPFVPHRLRTRAVQSIVQPTFAAPSIAPQVARPSLLRLRVSSPSRSRRRAAVLRLYPCLNPKCDPRFRMFVTVQSRPDPRLSLTTRATLLRRATRGSRLSYSLAGRRVSRACPVEPHAFCCKPRPRLRQVIVVVEDDGYDVLGLVRYGCPSVLGIPLGITKDQLVPTGAHVARVWGRASSGAEVEVGTRASWRLTRSDRGGP